MRLIKRLKSLIRKITFQSSKYWEERYHSGGNSGAGSYNQVAKYKSNFLNKFLEENQIKKTVDFGCGDGNQISQINFENYFGLDVSKTAVEICKKRYSNDPSKKFYQYSGDNIEIKKTINEFNADLSISLDVIYHLVEDSIFEKYIADLFSFSTRFVIIFSTDIDEICSLHHRNRKFTSYIKEHIPSWKLVEVIDNPNKGEDSQADFFIYAKI